MTTHAIEVGSGVSAIIGVTMVVLLGLLGALVLVVLVVANRAEPDSRGLRPFSVYLFGMAFVMLFAAYTGSIVVVLSLTRLVEAHASPLTNSIARGCAVGGIITVLAGATFGYHLIRGRRFALSDGRIDGPNNRILHTYVAVVAFVYIAIAVVALGVSIYYVFELAGPGVFGLGRTHSMTVRALIDSGYVTVVAAVIAWIHMRWGPRQLLPGFGAWAPSPGQGNAPTSAAPSGPAHAVRPPYGQAPPPR